MGKERQNNIPMEVILPCGNISYDTAKVLETWKKHFDELFNPRSGCLNDNFLSDQPTNNTNDDHLNLTISRDEIKMALRCLHDKKAEGIDEIAAEILKNHNLISLLEALFNLCFTLGRVPELWRTGIITPVLKSSTTDKRDPANYRGITITPAVYKLYCNVINNRLKKWEDENSILCDPQNGFRKGRSTVDHIVSLTSLIETRKLKSQSTFTAFIDFTKAYDSINRELLFKKISSMGITGRIHKAITSLYDNVKCCVRLNGLKTDYFEVKCGLKQGCTLSTLHFNLYVNDLVIKINSLDAGIDIGGEKVSILLYADDLVLVASSEGELQALLQELNVWCQNNGIKINEQKSNVIHFRPKSIPQSDHIFKCGDKCLKTVKQYIYLGILLSEHLDYNDMATHVSKSANRALGLVIAKSKSFGGLPFSSFTKLFDTMVWSVVSYGAAIWGTRQFNCINSIQLRAARYFMGVGKYTPNAAVMGDTGWKPTITRQWEVVIRQWLRMKVMGNDRLNRKIFDWAEDKGNGRCQNWNHRVNKMIEEVNIQYQPGETNSVTFKANIVSYLNDKCLASWQEDTCINREDALHGNGKNKLRTYKLFKSEYTTEEYLSIPIPRQHRSAYAKFRCGVAPIRLETGRYERLDVESRTCFTCPDMVENEEHVLLKCPLYNNLREALFTKLIYEFPDLYSRSDRERLCAILSCKLYSSIRACAKTCCDILKLRRNTLYS